MINSNLYILAVYVKKLSFLYFQGSCSSPDNFWLPTKGRKKFWARQISENFLCTRPLPTSPCLPAGRRRGGIFIGDKESTKHPAALFRSIYCPGLQPGGRGIYPAALFIVLDKIK
jgi:hypothetical protein